ncbi:MAG: virulence-associated protein E, partial [Clostridia bacterium]|nr:virulence-associated protein E [Clostridia bacterium]
MNNDRKIIISVGNNRRDLNWKQTALTVSELYERLRNPVRSTELFADYMKMKKAQQDTLKDVGGFVGGSLSSPRRKSNNVTGRDVITLD